MGNVYVLIVRLFVEWSLTGDAKVDPVVLFVHSTQMMILHMIHYGSGTAQAAWHPYPQQPELDFFWSVLLRSMVSGMYMSSGWSCCSAAMATVWKACSTYTASLAEVS